MANVTPGVGDPVQSRCTKCKRITRHFVVSLVEGKPVRVQCTACEGIHNYRPAKAPASPRSATAPRRRATSAAARSEAAAQEFEEAMGEKDRTRATAYQMTGTFRSRELLQHPTFGLGLVRKVVPPNKIHVLFRDGLRTLRCAG
ncbi:MAG TPA: hypothetical protein VK997_00930 [Deferrisomatales bacterium]|nr:hypothetical protein [Deferrisomatales bacterium]